MKAIPILRAVLAGCMSASAVAEEHDYYKYLRYPKELVPGVGVDTIEQEGGPNAVGYRRRTVQWEGRRMAKEAELSAGGYPGRNEAKMNAAQKEFVDHATADWEARTPEEVDGKAPPKMMKWLEKVRGY